jgi:dTDP-glucose 4,6-dehydratase
MNVIITGGCGFIGSFAVNKYLKEGHKVLNIDKLTYASDPKRIQKNKKNYFFIKDDISNPNLYKVINNFNPNIIINFAAETHVDNSIKNPSKFIYSNIIGTYNLLEISKKIWLKNKKKKFRFIQISTDEVFGSIKNKKPFDEQSNFRPNSPYSSSKASAELLVRAWNKTYGLPTVITYCTNNFGPSQNQEKLIPKILDNLKKNRKCPIFGNGKNKREWIFVDDHINYIYEISQKKKTNLRYFISDGNLYSNLELLKKIVKIYNEITNKKISFRDSFKFVKDRPGHDYKYQLRLSKSLKKKKNNFDNNLIKTIKWFLINSKKY